MKNTYRIFVLAALAVGLVACAQVKGSKDHTQRAAVAVQPDSAEIDVSKCTRGLFSLNLVKNHVEGGDPKVKATGFVTGKPLATDKVSPFKALFQDDVPDGAIPLSLLELRLGQEVPQGGQAVVPGDQRSQLREQMRAVKLDGREEEGQAFSSEKPLRYQVKEMSVAKMSDLSADKAAAEVPAGIGEVRSFLLALGYQFEDDKKAKHGLESEMAFAVPLDVELPDADTTEQIKMGSDGSIEVPVNPQTGSLGAGATAYLAVWIQELSPTNQPKWMTARIVEDKGQSSVTLKSQAGKKTVIGKGNAKLLVKRRELRSVEVADGIGGNLCVESVAAVVKLATIE